MLNILSYVGMNLQSELCLWTLLGLLRTIFDATLFKVNANLKQVWQMSMPEQLSMPVQRVLRTMISGIMLVQCFTVYVYLAAYIVLLYPVFLEERPALVLPWLLLAAIRQLLCELTSLAVGLGTCVLLGTAKPACIKFIVTKFSSIMPAFYMWLLVYSYYKVLKVTSAFKTFPAMLPPSESDDSLELAVRRRRTKSLFPEEHLRKHLVTGFYPGPSTPCNNSVSPRAQLNKTESPVPPKESHSDSLQPLAAPSNRNNDVGTYDDWFGSEVIVPRGDRILEQFVTMLLRIGIYLNKDEAESIKSHMFNANISTLWVPCENIETVSSDGSDTPPLVANSKGQTASYLREYPQIFMKRLSSETPHSAVVQVQNKDNFIKNPKKDPHETQQAEIDKNVSIRTLSLQNKSSSVSSLSIKTLPKPDTKQIATRDSDLKLNTFMLDIVNSCIETASEGLKQFRKEENLAALQVSSEILLPKGVAKEKQVSYEKAGAQDHEKSAIDIAKFFDNSDEDQKSIILEVRSNQAAADKPVGTSKQAESKINGTSPDGDQFTTKKPKKD